MVIWTGRGWIGFIFMVGCLIGGERLIDWQLGDAYFEGHVWPKFLILAVCSALCWITGRSLNNGLPSRIFDVPGKTPNGPGNPSGSAGHTLGFVRLEYAGLIAAPLYLYIALEQAGLV